MLIPEQEVRTLRGNGLERQSQDGVEGFFQRLIHGQGFHDLAEDRQPVGCRQPLGGRRRHGRRGYGHELVRPREKILALGEGENFGRRTLSTFSEAKGRRCFVGAGGRGQSVRHPQLGFANADDIAKVERRARLDALSVVIGAVGAAAVVENKKLAVTPDFSVET